MQTSRMPGFRMGETVVVVTSTVVMERVIIATLFAQKIQQQYVEDAALTAYISLEVSTSLIFTSNRLFVFYLP